MLNFLILTLSLIHFRIECLKGKTRPNFLFVLTDDQDLILGGMKPLVKARKIILEKGAEFTNMFVSSPLCCPSRSSILTGLYAHNHGVINNSISGNCSSRSWQKHFENQTFARYLKDSGYKTFYAGKYLNQYGIPSSGGVSHIPKGWDHWIGLVGNSKYYNYTLSVNGKAESHYDDPNRDYLTDILFDRAFEFVRDYSSSQPFFLMISPPAPHAPFTPAPEYRNEFQNVSAPRTPNFHIPPSNKKHWLLRQPHYPLPKSVIAAIDDAYRNRWRTLLSVDDGIQRLYNILKKRKFLKNTFIVLTSDNGYHLGQFSLPLDKRQLYEFDVRVPLLIRGPKIQPAVKIEVPVMNIDLAPTFLTLAGIKPPKFMDGSSFSHLLRSSRIKVGQQKFLIEHSGESTSSLIPGCPQYKIGEVHTCDLDCVCEDSWNNTYVCIRTISSLENTVYCRFQDNENFIEFYNLTSDPYQLRNLHNILTHNIKFLKEKDLRKLSNCKGASCHQC